MMITSAENRGWSGDVAVSDLKVSGLPAASIVRTAKIATIETRESERVGVLPSGNRAAISKHLKTILAGALEIRRRVFTTRHDRLAASAPLRKPREIFTCQQADFLRSFQERQDMARNSIHVEGRQPLAH